MTMLIQRNIPNQISVFHLKYCFTSGQKSISGLGICICIDFKSYLPDSFRDSSLTRVFKILPVSVSVLFICNFRYLRFVISFICFLKVSHQNKVSSQCQDLFKNRPLFKDL